MSRPRPTQHVTRVRDCVCEAGSSRVCTRRVIDGCASVLVVVCLITLVGCQKQAVVPTPSSQVPIAPKIQPSIIGLEEATGPTIRARTPGQFEVGTVFSMRDWQNPTCNDLQQLRAIGITRIGYVGHPPVSASLWDCAADLGMMIDPTYCFSVQCFEWLRDNVYNDPHRSQAAGWWSGIDEPGPNNCPVALQCYTDMARLFNESQQQVPALETMLTLSAGPLTNHARWVAEGAPYCNLVDRCSSDYFPVQWGEPNDPAPTVITFVSNLVAWNGSGDYFYSDGGSNGAFPSGPTLVLEWQILEIGRAIRDNGALVYGLFDTRGYGPGTQQWIEIVKALEQLTPAPTDINHDGVVDWRDCNVADDAANSFLRDRILLEIGSCDPPPLHKVYLPLVMRAPQPGSNPS